MQSAARSWPACRAFARRWPSPSLTAPRSTWALWLSPLALSACCGTLPASNLPTIPPSLDRPCYRGPTLPDRDVTVAELLEIMAQREAAARECAARVQGLRAGWPR